MCFVLLLEYMLPTVLTILMNVGFMSGDDHGAGVAVSKDTGHEHGGGGGVALFDY